MSAKYEIECNMGHVFTGLVRLPTRCPDCGAPIRYALPTWDDQEREPKPHKERETR